MALSQLATPAIKPPTSLDLLGQNEQGQSQGAQATSLAAPAAGQAAGGLQPPQTMQATGASGLPGPDVSGFASQQMANPSRYDSSIIKQGIDLINQNSEEGRQQGIDQMDEFYSSRGLVGSSVEAKGRGDFLSQLARTKDQAMFDLVREMANTYSQDVSTAGQLGLGARAQELQAMGMGSDDAYRYAVLEQSGSQFEQSLGQRQAEFGGQMGIAQQDVDLRAQQLQQQAQLEGRALSIEEARQQAQEEQYGQALQLQREELAQQLGLDQQALDLQREEMTNRYADSQANRLLQMQLQQGDQDFARIENSLNRSLEQQALQLQREGLDAETAWREADRQLEQQLETRALDLQQQGMTLDQAYREAALQLDRDQMAQAGQVADQQAQLSAADIYLRALAAGAGDGGDLDYPNVGLIGGGTTANPGGSGGGGGGGTIPIMPPTGDPLPPPGGTFDGPGTLPPPYGYPWPYGGQI